MSTPLTLMAVHAHPDDESSSTGGVLARYADEGVRTVVVTCTNGELGDATGRDQAGRGGPRRSRGRPHPSRRARASVRDARRRASRATRVPRLGNGRLGAQGPSRRVLQRLGRRRRRTPLAPVRAIRTRRDRDLRRARRLRPPRSRPRQPRRNGRGRTTGIPRKAYFTAFRRSMFAKFRAVLEEQGVDISQFPQPDPEQVRMMDAVEARITTVVDVSPFVERKRTALATHASQIKSRSGRGFLPRRSARSLVKRPSSERTTPPARAAGGGPLRRLGLAIGGSS